MNYAPTYPRRQHGEVEVDGTVWHIHWEFRGQLLDGSEGSEGLVDSNLQASRRLLHLLLNVVRLPITYIIMTSPLRHASSNLFIAQHTCLSIDQFDALVVIGSDGRLLAGDASLLEVQAGVHALVAKNGSLSGTYMPHLLPHPPCSPCAGSRASPAAGTVPSPQSACRGCRPRLRGSGLPFAAPASSHSGYAAAPGQRAKVSAQYKRPNIYIR